MAASDLGDLLQAFAAIAVVLFGLLGGKKKGKSTSSARRAPERRPPPRPRPAAQSSRTRARPADPLLLALQQRLDQARGMPAAASMPQPAEAISLEGPSLEVPVEAAHALGEKEHAAFEKKYVKPLKDPVQSVVTASRPAGGFPQALVWAEILAPPKALRD